VAPGGEARRADRQVTVGRRHDVHRVERRRGGAVIGRGAIRRHALPDRPRQTRRRDVGDPTPRRARAARAGAFAPAPSRRAGRSPPGSTPLTRSPPEVLGDLVVSMRDFIQRTTRRSAVATKTRSARVLGLPEAAWPIAHRHLEHANAAHPQQRRDERGSRDRARARAGHSRAGTRGTYSRCPGPPRR